MLMWGEKRVGLEFTCEESGANEGCTQLEIHLSFVYQPFLNRRRRREESDGATNINAQTRIQIQDSDSDSEKNSQCAQMRQLCWLVFVIIPGFGWLPCQRRNHTTHLSHCCDEHEPWHYCFLGEQGKVERRLWNLSSNITAALYVSLSPIERVSQPSRCASFLCRSPSFPPRATHPSLHSSVSTDDTVFTPVWL